MWTFSHSQSIAYINIVECMVGNRSPHTIQYQGHNLLFISPHVSTVTYACQCMNNGTTSHAAHSGCNWTLSDVQVCCTSCAIIHAVMCAMNSRRLRKRLRLPNCNCSIAVLDEISQFPLYPTAIAWCML